MKTIPIYTKNNWLLLQQAFPQVKVKHGILAVYLNRQLHKNLLIKINKVNPYLAKLLQSQIKNTYALFIYTPRRKQL